MKATYYMNAFNDCESNPKEMWRKISDLTNKRAKTTNISEIAEEGVILTDPTEIANSFNKFFAKLDQIYQINHQIRIIHQNRT